MKKPKCLRRKIFILAECFLALFLMYFGAFSGECYVSRIYYQANAEIYYHSRQYIFGKLLWESENIDRILSEDEASKYLTDDVYMCEISDRIVHWRGFGYIIKWKEPLDLIICDH
jgi:hypothetical protein